MGFKYFTTENPEILPAFAGRQAQRTTEDDNNITCKIIGCAIIVHNTLGPGLLESAYGACPPPNVPGY